MALARIVYVSKKRPETAPTALVAMVETAQVRNEHRGITGILLYARGAFLQVLEGEQSEIDDLYTRICKDRRHERVMRLVREPIAGRSFGPWRMGFVSIPDLESASIGEYGPFPVDAGPAVAFAERLRERLLAV